MSELVAVSGESGDILVFMPGMGEINSTINGIRAAKLNERVALIPLHGELQPEDQDLAFAPNPLRKIVVSTNVAETSEADSFDAACAHAPGTSLRSTSGGDDPLPDIASTPPISARSRKRAAAGRDTASVRRRAC